MTTITSTLDIYITQVFPFRDIRMTHIYTHTPTQVFQSIYDHDVRLCIVVCTYISIYVIYLLLVGLRIDIYLTPRFTCVVTCFCVSAVCMGQERFADATNDPFVTCSRM